ncbi:TetR/AcrR family transcriptional regulator [Frankia sp. R82]|uniref:TetR/AcrR family transcriptional regulator n=1 Tax=Frankia sp. R82 TaxID=2950553 RepID=UPI002043D6AF|nr:TetR/AcrR family transcriptional regulator [Frankia sp. R82]MCM3884348.1 TetR/AcrR family transcriptional regulator [Frankia sp. R82]
MQISAGRAGGGSGGYARRPGSMGWWADRVGAAARRRPRAGGLSTQRIVQAAIEVLNERGFEALTVRAVADRLDTSSGALYQHIASRDELIVLVADHYLGQARLRPGSGADWRTDVEELIREIRRILLEAPLPPSASTDRAIWGPGTLRIVDAALGLFLAAGLTNDQASFATAAIIDFVFGAVSIQRGSGGRGLHGAGDGDSIRTFLETLPGDQYTALRTAGPAFLAASADSVFAQGMAFVLDGVASRFFGQP